MSRPLILHSTSVPRVRFKALHIKIRVRHISLRNSISHSKVNLRTSYRNKTERTNKPLNNSPRHTIRRTLLKATIPSTSSLHLNSPRDSHSLRPPNTSSSLQIDPTHNINNLRRPNNDGNTSLHHLNNTRNSSSLRLSDSKGTLPQPPAMPLQPLRRT